MKKFLRSSAVTLVFVASIIPMTALGADSPLGGGGTGGTASGPLGGTIQSKFAAVLDFLNTYVISGIFALAFIVFLWFVFVYFIAGGADEEKRAKGKQFVMWSIIGFVLMFSLWGIVKVIQSSLGPEFTSGGTNPDLPQFQKRTTTP